MKKYIPTSVSKGYLNEESVYLEDVLKILKAEGA
jgi:hypothetical protein